MCQQPPTLPCIAPVLESLASSSQDASPEQLRPSVGHITLFVGLDASSETLELPTHQIWKVENHVLESDTHVEIDHMTLGEALGGEEGEHHLVRATVGE
jgi:hypothetical protein